MRCLAPERERRCRNAASSQKTTDTTRGQTIGWRRENPKTSVTIWKHLWTSQNILNTSENLYRISVINWGHPGKKCLHSGWLSIKVTTQLKTLENSWEYRKTSKSSDSILRTHIVTVARKSLVSRDDTRHFWSRPDEKHDSSGRDANCISRC